MRKKKKLEQGERGQVENSRHEEIGCDESPSESSPPRLAGLIEGYTLNFLDVAIPSCTFALQEIA